jgi:hypothetical protein
MGMVAVGYRQLLGHGHRTSRRALYFEKQRPMPDFNGIKMAQINSLIAYLKTL